ncbi:MAG: hypothetical protein SFX73_24505 [Kofleriaceae bacterium]|nr:hypothetical protein [Kofleriaceae bacterium]
MTRVLATAACVLLAGASLVHAEDEIVVGTVVKIEEQEIYVSAGALKGIVDGAALRVKRPIQLRHPVTRAMVDDWIPIGAVTVTQVGGALSRAVVGGLVGQIKVGDIVEILVDRADAPPAVPVPEPTPQGPSAPPPDPVTSEVLMVFASQTGKPVEARIAGWEEYLSSRPTSRYAEGIRTDLDVLRGLRDQLRATSAPTGSESVTSVRHIPRTRAASREEIPLVFVLDDPRAVASGFLHYRARGARTYRRVLLQREHEVYLRGSIPADAVAQPGIDYFLEVSSPAGAAGLAVGSPTEPIAVEVAKPTVADELGPRPGQSSVKLAFDYLDFATFDTRAGDHTDRMVTANVDFTYRLASVVRSIGVGYGVFVGRGGSANQVWDLANPIPTSGFHYGYADLELGGTQGGVELSFGGKLIAGVGKDGFGMGGEGRMRIGRREGTNLAFAARTIDQVGTLSDIRFGANPASHLLLGISVGATTQPTEDDVGVKLGTELEWIGFSNVSIILRASWQGRNASHGGVGGGGGLGVYW